MARFCWAFVSIHQCLVLSKTTVDFPAQDVSTSIVIGEFVDWPKAGETPVGGIQKVHYGMIDCEWLNEKEYLPSECDLLGFQDY